MIGDKASARVDTFLKVIRPQVYAYGKIFGEVKIKRNGVVEKVFNTATANFKNKTAQGAATGTFLAVNKARLKMTDVTEYEVNTSLDAGGDGTVDNAVFAFSWTNSYGSTKTLDQLEIGYDLGGGGEVVYCQTGTGLAKPVEDGDLIEITWTITFAYSSGPMEDLYRFNWAQMIATGSFSAINRVNFINTLSDDHCETATLDSGGDGSQNWHKWKGTFTAVGDITIDILVWGGGAVCPPVPLYISDNITNKTLSVSEQLEVYITITHN